MKSYNLDLHIHTVLSPCAGLLMTPGNIIEQSLNKGLDIIAVTDHNSAGNVRAIMEMARNTELEIIPGMELETAEEVHLLCLFDSLEQALNWQDIVYNSLPPAKNNEEFFGYQLLVDKNDKIVSREDRLLATASSITVKEAVEGVAELAGIVIPAHIDRSNSILTNLGFIPPGLNVQILEISRNTVPAEVNKEFPFLNKYTLVKNSDSHYLQDIKPYMEIALSEITVENLRKSADKINFI